MSELSHIVEAAKSAWTVLGPLAGGTGIWAYLRSREPKKSSPSEIGDSQAKLVIAVNEQTRTILEENVRLRRDSNSERRALKRAVERISAEVAECHGKHEECEERVSGLYDEVNSQRQQIELLMEQNPPAAQYDTITRVPKKGH